MSLTTCATEVGTNLVSFALDPEDTNSALGELPSTGGVDRDTIQYELRFLRLFAVDYGITLGLGSKSPEKEKATKWYFSCLDSVVRDFPNDVGARFLGILRDRVDNYVMTLKLSSNEEPFSIIGQSFAKFCGNEEDTDLATLGRKIFLSTANGVADYLRSVKIKA